MSIFKTDNGDFDVSKMSLENQRNFELAQYLIIDIESLSKDIQTKKAALEYFKLQLNTECNNDTKISYTRARDDEGKFIGDDPDTPENEAYVPSDK